jgi:hypothetical protein
MSKTLTTSSSSIIPYQENGEEILPIQCYICETKISEKCRSVLQLWSCSVVACQSCAINRMAWNEEFALDCLICGSKVDTSTGIIRNLEKVKEAEEKYLERAFKYYKLPVPSKNSRAMTKFQALKLKFADSGFKKYTNELHLSSSSSSKGNTYRQKQDLSYIRLQLSRIEHIRGGSLADMEGIENNDLTIDEEKNLPLGPLLYLQLSRNIFLERLITASSLNENNDSTAAIAEEEEIIDTTCVICQDRIKAGNTVLFSCDCLMLICYKCAINDLINSTTTYRRGVKCPCCRQYSLISFANIDECKNEEDRLLKLLIANHSDKDNHYSFRSVTDLKRLLEFLWSNGFLPSNWCCDIHSLSIHQVRLELSRLYIYLERKKLEETGIETIKIGKKENERKDDEPSSPFTSSVSSNRKLSPPPPPPPKRKETMKDDEDGVMRFSSSNDDEDDNMIVIDEDEDPAVRYEEEKDSDFPIPLGPLRFLKLKNNPYVELYLNHTTFEAEEDVFEKIDWSLFRFNPNAASSSTSSSSSTALIPKIKIEDTAKPVVVNSENRFDIFKPKWNIICPKCSINPQNKTYLRFHLENIHDINDFDELEKLMSLAECSPCPPLIRRPKPISSVAIVSKPTTPVKAKKPSSSSLTPTSLASPGKGIQQQQQRRKNQISYDDEEGEEHDGIFESSHTVPMTKEGERSDQNVDGRSSSAVSEVSHDITNVIAIKDEERVMRERKESDSIDLSNFTSLVQNVRDFFMFSFPLFTYLFSFFLRFVRFLMKRMKKKSQKINSVFLHR